MTDPAEPMILPAAAGAKAAALSRGILRLYAEMLAVQEGDIAAPAEPFAAACYELAEAAADLRETIAAREADETARRWRWATPSAN